MERKILHCVNEASDIFSISTNVQWLMSNERSALAMLIVGFSVAGVVILAVIFGQI
jgi:hypothetical protein